MSNILASSAVLPHHFPQNRIVDLRKHLHVCPATDRPAWTALLLRLQESKDQHSQELHVEQDLQCLKLRSRTLSGFVETRLGNDDSLANVLPLLESTLWPEKHRSAGLRAWFIMSLSSRDYLFQLDRVKTSAGCNYTFTRQYDIQNPLPQLDQLITLPGQATLLREKLVRSQGFFLLADSDRISRVQTARALAQAMVGPDKRILLSETSCHPLVPGTTQIALPINAQRQQYRAWQQACEMHQDVIIAQDVDHEPVRLTRLAAEGCTVIVGVGANNASQALIQLMASGVRPEAAGRVLKGIVVQHQVALACEACKCPSEIDETLNRWIGMQIPIRSGTIQGWLADRMTDRFMQAEGCPACHHSGVQNIILSVDCVDIENETQDALCDGDVRYALQSIARLEQHARQLVVLARSGRVAVKHAMERLEKLAA